jgi:hypothetical protein
MNHPTTPLASAEINHDQLKVELIEPLARAHIVLASLKAGGR